MRKLLIAVILTIWGGTSCLYAQETTSTSGGEATGTSGTASYTVGQAVYTTNIGANGSLAQGVQQPFEISVVTGIEVAKGISLNVSAYPNPTTDYLTVKVKNYETANIQYHVFDINGKLLQSIKAIGKATRINIEDYPSANYLVKVLDNNREIKVFKVIKN